MIEVKVRVVWHQSFSGERGGTYLLASAASVPVLSDAYIMMRCATKPFAVT